jgi:hypothetical protein
MLVLAVPKANNVTGANIDDNAQVLAANTTQDDAMVQANNTANAYNISAEIIGATDTATSRTAAQYILPVEVSTAIQTQNDNEQIATLNSASDYTGHTDMRLEGSFSTGGAVAAHHLC